MGATGARALGRELVAEDFRKAAAVAIDAGEQRHRLGIAGKPVERHFAGDRLAVLADPPQGIAIEPVAEALEDVAEIIELAVREALRAAAAWISRRSSPSGSRASAAVSAASSVAAVCSRAAGKCNMPQQSASRARSLAPDQIPVAASRKRVGAIAIPFLSFPFACTPAAGRLVPTIRPSKPCRFWSKRHGPGRSRRQSSRHDTHSPWPVGPDRSRRLPGRRRASRQPDGRAGRR